MVMTLLSVSCEYCVAVAPSDPDMCMLRKVTLTSNGSNEGQLAPIGNTLNVEACSTLLQQDLLKYNVN